MQYSTVQYSAIQTYKKDDGVVVDLYIQRYRNKNRMEERRTEQRAGINSYAIFACCSNLLSWLVGWLVG